VTNNKKPSVAQTMGGIIVGFDQQILRSTPPASELVAKGAPLAPVAASGGGTFSIDLPDDAEHHGDPAGSGATLDPDAIRLSAPGVAATIDLAAGGRVSSLVVGGRELLKTEGDRPVAWGSFPMVPYAGRIRGGAFSFEGRTYRLPTTMPPHAIHGTVLERRWHLVGDATIAIDLGPDWPFRGSVVQRFELGSDHLTCRLELHADERMPASMGWHPWFVRRLAPGAVTGGRPEAEPGALEIELDAGAMFVRDDEGIATERRIPQPEGPWDDCFTDLRRAPVLRWPGFLELTVESGCPAWVVYTVPEDTICVEPQTAPPDALNTWPSVVEPEHPLTAEMTWRWRSLAG
jgi:aldose 1-epimerase